MDAPMDRHDRSLRRAAVVAGYLLVGAVGTAAVGIVALNLLQLVQRGAYHAVYRTLGPSEATEFAILTHFVLSGAVAIAVPTLAAAYVAERGENVRAYAAAVAVIAGLLVLYAVVSLVVEAGAPIALGWVILVAVAVPAVLWVGYGVRSGGLAAFVGGVPVLVFMLLLAGFGLGWGWGYVVTAEAVPASTVDGADASFDDVPAVRDALFAGSSCETDPDGDRVCRLPLRGYEHERTAARFMDRHGVRCPYQGSGNPEGSFVARHDGEYYRVTCSPHGD